MYSIMTVTIFLPKVLLGEVRKASFGAALDGMFMPLQFWLTLKAGLELGREQSTIVQRQLDRPDGFVSFLLITKPGTLSECSCLCFCFPCSKTFSSLT